MILYNVTVSIDPSIKEEWISYMRSTHIPDVMATGCFIESRFSKLHAEDESEETYAIAYVAKNIDQLDIYQKEHAKKLQEDHSSRFMGKFGAFRSILSIIEEFK